VTTQFIGLFWFIVLGVAWKNRRDRRGGESLGRRDKVRLLSIACISTLVISIVVIVLIEMGLIDFFWYWPWGSVAGPNPFVLMLLSIPSAIYLLLVSIGREGIQTTPAAPLP
jgi:hypothetical protein